MPNRIPEDMSDRMPQDLPVRKCINVMVGITRSKVFLPWAEPRHLWQSRAITFDKRFPIQPQSTNLKKNMRNT